MAKRETDFNIPPISPLVGSTIPNFFRVISMGKIALRLIPTLLLTFLVILIATPFQLYEYFYFRNKVKNHKFNKPPVFIIGHWRSGTTHLHNLLCQDPANGFTTTYHAVFPNNLKSKWIFKPFMKLNMPDKRPSDNIRLSTEFPQEEEFALGNMTHATFYHFFYFPSINDLLYEKYIRFHGISSNEKNKFKSKYHELLVKAALNTGKDQLIIKNPVNTGKIKLLLEMFPDAKFIHIYRNPIVTYLSTVKFYNSLLPTSSLENYEDEYVIQKIILNYKNLMNDFFETKDLIPKENLYEIRYEEFEKDNLFYLKAIYEKLKLKTWDNAERFLSDYIQAQKHYEKNKYKITKAELELLLKEWGFAMEKLKYKTPENLDVI